MKDDGILKGMLMVQAAVTRPHEGAVGPAGEIADEVRRMIEERASRAAPRPTVTIPAQIPAAGNAVFTETRETGGGVSITARRNPG